MAGAGIFVRTRGKNYYLNNDEELTSGVATGKIPFSAWIYRGDSWMLLAEDPALRRAHPEFEEMPSDAPSKKEAETKGLPAQAVSASVGSGTISAEPVWFVVREKKKFGPYSAAEIVGQLQSKDLDSGAFVWRPGFATWQKLSQVVEFSRDSMKRLAQEKNSAEVLIKRKFPRAPFEVEVIAHDNTRALEGKSMVIGEGGLFLATPRPLHHVGARLKLHFREGDTPSFNAVAEVVSVVRGEAPQFNGYSMRFVALSDSDRRRIAKLVSERKGGKSI